MDIEWKDTTHCRHWSFTKEGLKLVRSQVEGNTGKLRRPVPPRTVFGVFFEAEMTVLGRQLKRHPRCMATAHVYLRRFYTKVSIRQRNPFAVMAACIYLAGKAEECPAHISEVATSAYKLWPDFFPKDKREEFICEQEFELVSILNAHLIVHHPFRILDDIWSLLGLTGDEYRAAEIFINDSYRTDLSFLHSPVEIALTCILLGVIFCPETGVYQPMSKTKLMPGEFHTDEHRQARRNRMLAMSDIFKSHGHDENAIIRCTHEIVEMYKDWDTHSTRRCCEIVRLMFEELGFAHYRQRR